jgi:hypothetical protein
MPKLASIADRISFVRSLTGSAGAHDAFQCQSGYAAKDLQSIGGRPALGCVIAQQQGSTEDAIPPFIDLMQGRPLVRNSARPGFLGPKYSPFRPDLSKWFSRELELAMKNELAARGPHHTMELELTRGLTLERIDDRMKLLARFDQFRRDLDHSGSMDSQDRFTQKALGILTSGRLAEALDFEKEPLSVQRMYTPEVRTSGEKFYTSEDEHSAKKLLLARRMVEAGAGCVSVSFSDFDTHSRNFPRMRHLMPIVDHALHALYFDLEQRGMLDDVIVVAWGEFGRTPRVNKEGGRDHWPEVGPAILFGGGVQGGRIVGQTDRLGAKVVARPVSYQEMLATVCRCVGLDPALSLTDPFGRPQALLEHSSPIQEVF